MNTHKDKGVKIEELSGQVTLNVDVNKIGGKLCPVCEEEKHKYVKAVCQFINNL
jgi:NMD protein affecting ribosome stability and mRNA decay